MFFCSTFEASIAKRAANCKHAVNSIARHLPVIISNTLKLVRPIRLVILRQFDSNTIAAQNRSTISCIRAPELSSNQHTRPIFAIFIEILRPKQLATFLCFS